MKDRGIIQTMGRKEIFIINHAKYIRESSYAGLNGSLESEGALNNRKLMTVSLVIGYFCNNVFSERKGYSLRLTNS